MAKRLTSLKARRMFKTRLLLGLVFKPVRIFCEQCDKYIPSDMEWSCGHCNFENSATKIYSFLYKCRNCKRPPQAIICPHCGVANPLERNANASHPATKAGSAPLPKYVPTRAEVRAQERAEKREKHQEKKEDIGQDIEIAKLNSQLAQYEEAGMGKAERILKKLEQDLEEHDAQFMGAKDLKRRKQQENAEKYKDNPAGLQDSTDSLNAWGEKHTD